MFLPAYPLHVVLIVTNRCNLRCTHCSSAAGEASREELTRAELERIIAELSDLGVVDLALSGGEPLMYPDLPDLISFARAAGMRVGTSTNGAPLTARRAERLRDAGLSRLQISIDGPAPVHDRIRGRGSFARAVTAVERSLAAGLRTHLCFTAMRSNHAYLGDVIELARSMGVDGFNLSQFVPVGRGCLEEDLRPSESLELMRRWASERRKSPQIAFYAHLSGLAAVDLEAASAPGFIGCQAGIHIACVTALGDVLPCVMFPLALGNVRKQSFREIWEGSPVVADLRARVLGDGCGSCSHRLRCGGCRAAAYIHTGDYRADDPRCWLLQGKPGEVGTNHAAHRRVLPTIDA